MSGLGGGPLSGLQTVTFTSERKEREFRKLKRPTVDSKGTKDSNTTETKLDIDN